MNNKLLNVFMFAVGAAIGSAVTWKIVKTKYEQIAQEEIDSVKEEYSRLTKLMKKEIDACRKITDSCQNDEQNEEAEEDNYRSNDDELGFTERDQEMVDYYNITRSYRSSCNETEDKIDDENDKEGGEWEEAEVPYINGPYVISPEDFSSSPPGYNAQPLDYFVDGILADNWGVTLDIEETIGEDSLAHFGEYVDDIVYVRNERTETDYEVTRDPRTYGESVRTSPDPYYGKYEN